MASLAKMERELIVERTCAGLQAARRQGRVGGRKRQMTDSKIQAARKLLASGTPPYEVAHSLGVSVPTLYRWVPGLFANVGFALAGRPCFLVNSLPPNENF
jgi:DNA invertase Pin-like site-specific DNA recombinase